MMLRRLQVLRILVVWKSPELLATVMSDAEDPCSVNTADEPESVLHKRRHVVLHGLFENLEHIFLFRVSMWHKCKRIAK